MNVTRLTVFVVLSGLSVYGLTGLAVTNKKAVSGKRTFLEVTTGVSDDPLDIHNPIEPMQIALTVDDIPTHEENRPWATRRQVLQKIAEAFKDVGVRGAYGFVNGAGMTAYELEMFKDWRSAGFFLGNHTLHHTSLTKNSAKDFIKDIEGTDQLLAQAGVGIPERRFFRYPYLQEGDTLKKRDAVRKYLFDNGFKIAQVTIDYWDWHWNLAYAKCMTNVDMAGVQTIKSEVVESALREIRHAQKTAKFLFGRDIKHVLLLHQTSLDAETLPEILSRFKKDGAQFISLEEALADPVYDRNPNDADTDSGSFLDQILNAVNKDDPFPNHKYPADDVEKICKPKI